MKQKKIAVVGGGASGMIAAITAARQGSAVTIYERNDRVGKKILATGNGKCNFSNRVMEESFFYAEDKTKLSGVLQAFSSSDTENFFSELGMLIREKDGYLYPASEQASTVLDILRMEINRLGIRVLTETKVKKIGVINKNCFLVINEKQEEIYDAVILACGSKASPKTGSDGSGYLLAKGLGHRVTEVVPALVQLKTRENLKAVSGVRAKARVKLFIDGKEKAAESGEVQFTDTGISGIVVFQFSRLAAYALKNGQHGEVTMDFLPDFGETEYRKFTRERIDALQDKTVEQFFTGMLNKKLMLYFIKEASLNPEMPVSKADMEKLYHVFSLCRRFSLTVTGTNSFDNAQVCAGGVPLAEVTEKMESRIHPGLFFAGELLDVDGKCGGYNLQWAWSSGYVAGKHAAETSDRQE